MSTQYANGNVAQAALAQLLLDRGLNPRNRLVGQDAVVAEALANILNGGIGELDANAPGAGALGTGGFLKRSVVREGSLIITRIVVDLTGLGSSTTDLDIIGQGASAAHLGQLTAAANGTIIGGAMRCLEAPAGGVTDIDLYKATVGTGVFDAAVTGLTGQAAVITSGAAWTLGRDVGTAADGIAAGDYLYLACGAAGVPGTYTAGRFLITLFGY